MEVEPHIRYKSNLLDEITFVVAVEKQDQCGILTNPNINSPTFLTNYKLAVFEFENFRGKKVELSGECKDVLEKTQRVGSVIVESGP